MLPEHWVVYPWSCFVRWSGSSAAGPAPRQRRTMGGLSQDERRRSRRHPRPQAEIREFAAFIIDPKRSPLRLEVITSVLARRLLDAINANGAAPVAILQRELAAYPEVMASIIAVDSSTEAGGPEGQPRFVLRWAREALKPQPPTRAVVHGLCLVGDVVLVVGAPGSYKTWAVLDLGICIALGIPWLGMQTVQGTVLVIDEESGEPRLLRRIAQLMRAHGAGADTPLAYVSLAGFNLRNPDDVALVARMLDQVQPSLVIWDALADIMPGADENAVKDVQPVFGVLRRLAAEKDATMVMIHHANKAGGYRGSTAMSGAVDLLLMVEREAEDGLISFVTEKTRDIAPLSFQASITFNGDDETTRHVSLQSTQPTARPPRQTPAEAYVLRYLGEHGPSLLQDIQGHADTCTERTAKNAVYSLARLGRVKRCDEGSQGSLATYELVKEDVA